MNALAFRGPAPLRGLAFDRKTKPDAEAFKRARKTEQFYEKRLRQVARNVAGLMDGFNLEDLDGNVFLQTALNEYARILEPWAGSVATRMIRETAQRDEQNWAAIAARMGRSLRQEIETAPTGDVMRRLLSQQVDLITSLPREAALKVHELTQEARVQGTRPRETAERIKALGNVTSSRALLIARTETARTASVLTQARAQHIGCTHFTWVTAGDSRVRPSHRKLNGKTFRYDDPPVCDPPDFRALPGQIWNCRCIGIPVLED